MTPDSPDPLPDAVLQRRRMVDEQLRARGIHDDRVLAAMEAVPRECFVASQYETAAYEDRALPSAEGQTISQPYMVALMTQHLRLEPHHRVLEIGTGTGYQTAILAVLCAHVYSVERIAALSDAAAARLQRLQIGNVSYRVGDGSLGWPEQAPFHAILVTAGAPSVPPRLVQQLAVDGRVVIPVGERDEQTLLAVTRTAAGVVESRLVTCRFVKLIGNEAWPPE